MDARVILDIAGRYLSTLPGRHFDVLSVHKPTSLEAAANLAKIVSKLSPLVGNLIEFNTVEFLNTKAEFDGWGRWFRQDPGFPDTVFRGKISPPPGLEIKAWFPLATEMTARFKDSQAHFLGNNIDIAIIAWLPEHIIFGRPHVVDAITVPASSVAEARDLHYHNPPDYIVLEPGDTTERTANLQQTNTNGYKWQGTPKQFEEAKKLVESWGPRGRIYKTDIVYQKLLRTLFAQYPYRLDTNYAKIDRIAHRGIEDFKTRVLDTIIHGATVRNWRPLIAADNKNTSLSSAVHNLLGVKQESAAKIIV